MLNVIMLSVVMLNVIALIMVVCSKGELLLLPTVVISESIFFVSHINPSLILESKGGAYFKATSYKLALKLNSFRHKFPHTLL